MTSEQLQYLRDNDIKFFDVYEIFKEHFGEERVDILDLPSEAAILGSLPHFQLYIIVHFPNVRVTNENNKFVDIQDLWARVKVNWEGRMCEYHFDMIRTTFSPVHALAGYSHSHLPTSALGVWHEPCLGQGPIRRTISSLQYRNSEEFWRLFCRELSEYVQVESLTGGPYIRLESIGSNGNASEFSCCFDRYYGGDDSFSINYDTVDPLTFKTSSFRLYSKSIIKELCNSGKLKFCYNNTKGYSIAMSGTQFRILVSNITLKILQEHNVTASSIMNTYSFTEFVYSNGCLYRPDHNHRMARFENIEPLFKFKNTDIKLQLTEQASALNTVKILNDDYVFKIYRTIILIVNCLYGKTEPESEISRRVAII